MSVQPLTRRAILALTAGGAFTAAIPGQAWASGSTRPGAVRAPKLTAADQQIVKAIRPGRALDQLFHLTEDIGQRYAGTPGEVQAAKYLERRLEKLGLDVETPSFSVPDVNLGKIISPALDSHLCWDCRSATGAPTGAEARGRLTQAYTVVADLPAKLNNRIVLVNNGTAVKDVVAAAQERRARAVIVLATPATPPRQSGPPSLSLTTPSTIPVLTVGQVQSKDLQRIAANERTISIETVAHKVITSRNVIATSPGSGPKRARKKVMISAHYDSVIGARGANDDGSGTVLTLELARVLHKMPHFHDLQFALWGAEEIGLVGSRDYVDSLNQNDRDNIAGVFQNDMVGTSWEEAEKYWVLSYDGKANPVNEQVLAAGKRLGYAKRMSDVTERGSSDHQSFQEVGVASGNFSWRGVEAPSLLEPEYHSADDTIRDNISVERLTVSMELIGTAAYALAATKS
ncbi:M20/M25/M40 family metallo-hydrolase [Demetria terragena]|uniref:M20/M25/M40 family metallo-hydrolase n=1 Tax=Demetria terragena TaxID=63959 RepID=UPI00037E365E|nr:M20/M25/M40 family metallo-hydrolase [Demetria terragena]